MRQLSKITFLLSAVALFAACSQQQSNATSEAEIKQKALEEKMMASGKAYVAAFESGDVSSLKEIMVPDFVSMQNGKQRAKNLEEIAQIITVNKTGSPDHKLSYEMLELSGNKTYTKYIYKGTNTGMLGDMPPTGKSFEVSGLNVVTYNDDGKMVSEENYIDRIGYMQSLGFTLTPPSFN